MMVMELQSRFPPSEVMDALSIVYPQFWIEPGHEDKLTCHMNTLKAKFCVPKQISSTPLQNETSPPLLDAAALVQGGHGEQFRACNACIGLECSSHNEGLA
jgi:hypothetical protein